MASKSKYGDALWRFIYHSPRGFSNEFAVYAVRRGTAEEKAALAWVENEGNKVDVVCYELTAKRAWEMVRPLERKRLAWVKRCESEGWSGKGEKKMLVIADWGLAHGQDYAAHVDAMPCWVDFRDV